jgi:hypothetical protein
MDTITMDNNGYNNNGYNGYNNNSHTSFIDKLNRGRQSASRKWRTSRHAQYSHARACAVSVGDKDVFLFECNTTRTRLLLNPVGRAT